LLSLLSFPTRRSSDLVRITFFYQARFDPSLHDQVLAQLISRPGVNIRQRGIPLRWVYPDAFFHFQDTGKMTIILNTSDFRSNETDRKSTRLNSSHVSI